MDEQQASKQSEIHQLQSFDIPEATQKIRNIKMGISPDDLLESQKYLISLQNRLLKLLNS